jgi:hypothetical protein
VLQKEVLTQNVRKKFWGVWRKFKKRKWKVMIKSNNKPITRRFKKKSKFVYNMSKKSVLCSFNQGKKQTQMEGNRETTTSVMSFQLKEQKDLFERVDFQTGFAGKIRKCSKQEVRDMDHQNLSRIIQDWG